MRNKITVFFILVFVFCTCFLWAGGQDEESPAVGAEEAVTLQFWMPGANDTQDEYFKQLGDSFSKENPNIKVEISILPSDMAGINQKLNAAKLSQTYPDVFSSFLAFMGPRGSKGEFMDLTDYFNSWEDKDDILDATLNMGKYQGKLIGLGYFPSPAVKAYRKDYLEEAGLPAKGAETWEDLMNIAVKASVRDSNGDLVRAGIDWPSISKGSVNIEPLMRQNGSMVIDEINQVPAWTDPGAVEALQFAVDLWNANVSFPHDWHDFSNHPFVNNRSAMGNIQASMYTNMIKNDPEMADKMFIGPVMERKEKWAFVGYRFFIIGADTKYPDEAWEFVKFMMSKEQFRERYKLLGLAPARKSLMPEYMAESPTNAMLAEYLKYGKGASIVPWSSIYYKYWRTTYEEAINKVKTPEQALKDFEMNVLEEMKTFKP